MSSSLVKFESVQLSTKELWQPSGYYPAVIRRFLFGVSGGLYTVKAYYPTAEAAARAPAEALAEAKAEFLAHSAAKSLASLHEVRA